VKVVVFLILILSKPYNNKFENKIKEVEK